MGGGKKSLFHSRRSREAIFYCWCGSPALFLPAVWVLFINYSSYKYCTAATLKWSVYHLSVVSGLFSTLTAAADLFVIISAEEFCFHHLLVLYLHSESQRPVKPRIVSDQTDVLFTTTDNTDCGFNFFFFFPDRTMAA